MAEKGKVAETPLMKQYNSIKSKHPDAILLFRVGDFYETFGDDAVKTSNILGITLTKRANGSAAYIDLAGFPHHALDTYLHKLVRAGQRVAICEQLEDPKQTKTIVKRGITEMITPGVSLHDNVLHHKENNFLASIHVEKKRIGVAFLDISTGEFLTAEGSPEYIDKLFTSFAPKEILVERKRKQYFKDSFGSTYYTYFLDDWVFTEDNAVNRIKKHFNISTLKGFGVQDLPLGTIAAGAILEYLDITQHHNVSHVSSLSRIDEGSYVWLDKFSIRNLELFRPLHDEGKALIDILDHTISPMGARLLKRWLALPLKEEYLIEERLDVVEYLLKTPDSRDVLKEQIYKIGDLERIISKVAVGKINPKEVVQIKRALESIEPIKTLCLHSNEESLKSIADQLNLCKEIRNRIEREIQPDPPVMLHKGNVIKTGVSEELDELRQIAFSGKDYLSNLQQRESEVTGIPSLKVGFNNVFGYYIEVRNTHKDKVPENWIRKQTLVSAERYITEELKEYESKILGAEEKINQLEAKLFGDLVLGISEYISAIQINANLIAKLDCLLNFAELSIVNKYVRPVINDKDTIDIKNGRHPVIEKQLPIGEQYIANDVYLGSSDQQVMIITGPNMAGKSALLRQVALITLMAQMGSFVPAESAAIGLVDKIFTRVGASDNISLGESTFMVEMHEAASILNNLSSRSLILLDELGRGTSTYDGISIAWAIVEYIHEHPQVKAKTMFATHYHELNEMERSFKRVKNYNVSVKELEDKVIFLRKLKRGGSEHSFGIHVAEMAGMPKSVVQRAGDILKELESNSKGESLSKPVKDIAQTREGFQLSFFQLDDPVLKQIRDEILNLDINNLTPVEALNKLHEIKNVTGVK